MSPSRSGPTPASESNCASNWSFSPSSFAPPPLEETLLPMFLANFNFCKFLAGSFSVVSKRIFARKYAFDSKERRRRAPAKSAGEERSPRAGDSLVLSSPASLACFACNVALQASYTCDLHVRQANLSANPHEFLSSIPSKFWRNSDKIGR